MERRSSPRSGIQHVVEYSRRCLELRIRKFEGIKGDLLLVVMERWPSPINCEAIYKLEPVQEGSLGCGSKTLGSYLSERWPSG